LRPGERKLLPMTDELKESPMTSYLWLIGLFAAWILLQTWILPKLGIPTCLSGACSAAQKKSESPKSP
jgi:hypothetical protein